MTGFVCPPEHAHTGSTVCYAIHKCRCAPCRTHRTSVERSRRRLKAYGLYDSGRVPADPVREHIEYLRAAGMGWKRIAAVAGLGTGTVSNLIYGRARNGRREHAPHVLKRTAEAILSVQPTLETLRPGALIPNVGFRRRAEALAWVGHSFSRQAAALGVLAGNFTAMRAREHVTVHYHAAMVDLFDQWWNTEPPATYWQEKSAVTRTRRFARERGFAPPLAWNNIDNPRERPGGIRRTAA